MCHSIRPHVIYFFNQSFFFDGSRNRSIHYQRIIFSSYNKSVYFYYTNVSKMIIVLPFLFLCHIISIFQSEWRTTQKWFEEWIVFAKNTFSFLGHTVGLKKVLHTIYYLVNALWKENWRGCKGTNIAVFYLSSNIIRTAVVPCQNGSFKKSRGLIICSHYKSIINKQTKIENLNSGSIVNVDTFNFLTIFTTYT